MKRRENDLSATQKYDDGIRAINSEKVIEEYAALVFS